MTVLEDGIPNVLRWHTMRPRLRRLPCGRLARWLVVCVARHWGDFGHGHKALIGGVVLWNLVNCLRVSRNHWQHLWSVQCLLHKFVLNNELGLRRRAYRNPSSPESWWWQLRKYLPWLRDLHWSVSNDLFPECDPTIATWDLTRCETYTVTYQDHHPSFRWPVNYKQKRDDEADEDPDFDVPNNGPEEC